MLGFRMWRPSFWFFWALALIDRALIAIIFIASSPPPVRAELSKQGLVRWFDGVPVLSAEAGVCARRRSNFLLRRQEKVTKEKATLHAASLRFAAGNLRCSRPAGSRSNSLHCVALKQSRALIRWPLRSSAHPEGNPRIGHPRAIASLRCARPSLRSAWRLRPRDGAERSKGPCGCSAVWLPTPAGCACGGAVAG